MLNDALAAVRRHFQDLDLRLRHALVGGLAAVDPELAVTLAFGRGIDGSKSVGAASSGRPTVCSVAACVAVLRRRKPGVTSGSHVCHASTSTSLLAEKARGFWHGIQFRPTIKKSELTLVL